MSTQTADPHASLIKKMQASLGGKLAAGKLVPPQQAHLKRYLFVFVVDISASTGVGGASADIHAINRDLGAMFDLLRNAPATSDLGRVKKQIDVALLTYSNDVHHVLDWLEAGDLPTTFNFTPQMSTATGKALNAAVDMIGARLRQFQQPGQKITAGIPHVFHVTDGQPTDMAIGSPAWIALQTRLAAFTGQANPEKTRPKLIHFITPNGCAVNPSGDLRDEQGNSISGQQLLSKLSGPASVVELAHGSGSMPAMVKLVTMVITRVSTIDGGNTDAAIRDGIKASGGALKGTPGGVTPTEI